MGNRELKNRIRDYIEHADERMLKLINAVIETEEIDFLHSHYAVLEDRLKYHRENPESGREWEEIRDSFIEKNGL